MASWTERTYDVLPAALQDLVVTAYGAMLYQRRYGSAGSRRLAHLLESQWYDAEQLRSLQLNLLRNVVDHAFQHVPFYRDAYAKVGYRSGELRSIDDLRHLPVVDKADIRRDPRRFVAENVPEKAVISGHTSGSTGTPLPTFKTRESYQNNWAFQERVRSWFAVPHRSVRASFGMRKVVPFGRSKNRCWRVDRFTRNWLFSSFHMGNTEVRSYLDELARIKPVEINGIPSCVARVATAIIEAGRTDIRPRVVITSAETVLDWQREVIERAFACPLRDQYGSSENVVWVSQCEHATYHEHPEYGLLETVKGGEPVLDEPGEVVGTGFVNLAMPLIRFRLGDSLVRSSVQGCACGRSFPIVREILGRTDDMMYRADGTPVPRLGFVFKDLKKTRESQVVQDDQNHIMVSIVTEGDATEDISRIRTKLASVFGPEFKIDIREVVDIPRTATGKFIFQRNDYARRRGL